MSDINIKNKRATFDYEFSEKDTEIAGLVLMGTEIKAIRAGKANLAGSYCIVNGREVFITGMHIAEHSRAGNQSHEPYRKRKLLLTRRQINKFVKKLETKGFTIVPVKLFIDKNGRAKLKIALAKGKKNYDKRQSIKERDVKRDMDRDDKF